MHNAHMPDVKVHCVLLCSVSVYDPTTFDCIFLLLLLNFGCHLKNTFRIEHENALAHWPPPLAAVNFTFWNFCAASHRRIRYYAEVLTSDLCGAVCTVHYEHHRVLPKCDEVNAWENFTGAPFLVFGFCLKSVRFTFTSFT